MKQRPVSITDLPASPDDDRRRRMRLYLILMIVRVTCLLLFLVVPGFWKIPLALGAVFLPYFAVVLGSVGRAKAQRADHHTLPEVGSGA